MGRISDHKGRVKQLLQKYECIRLQGSSDRTGDSYSNLDVDNIVGGDFPWTFRDVVDPTGERTPI